ncbi:RhuM family protein [Melaminivora suipulveris]|nr:RhuM family protein [Melaminivora suipulveris]
MTTPSQIVIFESDHHAVQVRLEGESVWLSQAQMADLFGTSTDNVGLHLKNIYQDKELQEQSTTEDYSVVRQEGARQVRRKLRHYNLDAIISVGYRVSSTRATRFRQWATTVLRDHLVQGYTVNRQRFEHNAAELEAALALVRKAAAGEALTTDQGRGLVDVIARYTHTFLWLQRYDEGLLPPVLGRQQAHRLLSVRGFSGAQRAPAAWRRACHQRRRIGRAGSAGGRVQPRRKRHHDPSDPEHAGAPGGRTRCLKTLPMPRRLPPTKEQSALLPPFPTLAPARIHVPATPEEFAAARAALLAAPVLGFDTESRPLFTVGAHDAGPALVQLATPQDAWLLQLHRPEALQLAREVLAQERILKVGFGLDNDRRSLPERLGTLPANVQDLDRVFARHGFGRNVGLRAAVALVLGQCLSKSKRLSTSNWSARTLSPGQIRYAANDAHGPAALYPALSAWEAAQPPVPAPRRQRGTDNPAADGHIST